MKNVRFLTLAGVVLAAILSRLIPHPWNMTPLTAVALFSGFHFGRKSTAFLLPFLTLILSDLLLGFHRTIPFVYGSFAITVLLGMLLKKNARFSSFALASIGSSVIFFGLTNFGYWLLTPTFAKTISGLSQCYIAAIPFFRQAMFGDLFYTALLFGAFSLAEKKFPALQPIRL